MTTVKRIGKTVKMTLGLLTFGVCCFLFSFESMAAEGTVKPSSAKIRKEASTSSEALASVESGDKLSIKAKTTGADGNVWYQVFVNADTLGFVRSDILGDVEGTVAELQVASSQTGENGAQSDTSAQSAEVEEMPSQSAVVSGGDVNVRSGASTSSSKVTTAKNGTAITVTGKASGADGKTWYQVSFIADGKEVAGFIREDYVELGEIIETAPEQEEAGEEEETAEEPEEILNKDYETVLETKEDGSQVWYLYDYPNNEKYPVSKLIEAAKGNSEVDESMEKQLKQQKIVIIVLVVLLVVMVLGLTLLIFKMREGGSFDEDEDEEEDNYEPAPVRKRPAAERAQRTSAGQTVRRPAQSGESIQRRPIQSAEGVQRRPIQEGAVRSKQTVRQTSGRPVRSAEGEPLRRQGAARPTAGNGAAAERRQTTGNGAGAERRQTAAGEARTAQKPKTAANMMPEREVTYEEEPKADVKKNRDGQWHSKNFLADDDEFEFEFLNMDDPNRL